jgi:hypothetical protein
MEDAMRKSGRIGPSEEQLKTRLEKAGFVDVQTFIVKQPLGPWAKAKYGSSDCRCAVGKQEIMLTQRPNYIGI